MTQSKIYKPHRDIEDLSTLHTAWTPRIGVGYVGWRRKNFTAWLCLGQRTTKTYSPSLQIISGCKGRKNDGPRGLEPRTNGLWVRYSNQLSYRPVYFTLYSYSSLQDLSHLVTYLLYAPSFNQFRASTTSKWLCLRFMRHLGRLLRCSICSHSITYLMYAHLLEKSCALPTTNRFRLNFFCLH